MGNGHEPASKADIAELRDEMRAMEDRFAEVVRDAQTEILKAIYGYMHTVDLTLKETVTAESFLRERLSVVESRLTEVERRLNLPPQSKR